MDALSALHREQVRLMEEITQISDGGDHSLLQKLSLLKAVVGHNEVSATTDLPRRGTSSREARERSTADFDGAADSPAPSPIVDKPTRKDRSAGTSRSSLPPKDTVPSIKQESLEAPGPSASAGAETNAKGKVTFAMGADVAFRLKQAPKPGENKSDLPEWIQGVVVKIIGEGKSRRYDVQDPAPDEVTNKPGQVYRTSASSMVPIPLSGAGLPDYPPGKVVLARYPDTTTFYRADVVGMNGGMVVLKFEDDEGEIREVERRLVLDHRY
jgi:SAGA-associated factor 29